MIKAQCTLKYLNSHMETAHCHWLTHFQMETRYDGELLHCQLFGGLLVTMATATLDFGTAS